MSIRTILISGGGTGGHLYPALTVSRTLKEKDPRLRFVFVGTERAVERDILNRHQVKSYSLKIEGLKGRGMKSFGALILLPGAFLRSFRLLRRIKPALVIGVGGYSSGPVVLTASLLKIPTLIMEQNLKPGFTNRMLIRWVKKAAVSFEESLVHFKGKGVYTGNPIREEFYRLRPKPRYDRLSLLIFGGSQGSHFLNTALTSCLPLISYKKDSFRIFHQTGAADLEWVRNEYERQGFRSPFVTIDEFFVDMPDFFAQADLIICRAGASTVAELIAARKASLLVPFAGAADNHQEENARLLEKSGGARVILESDLKPESLAGILLGFSTDMNKITVMEKKLSAFGVKKAADTISALCLDLMAKTPREE